MPQDQDHLASDMFFNYTPIPLKRGPLHFVCGTPAGQWRLAAEAIIYTITNKRSRSKKKWWSAEALHFDSEGPTTLHLNSGSLR
jgi:hypothetical protein